MPYVMESIVVQRGEKIVGLVYPDMEACDKAGFTHDDIVAQAEVIRKEVNSQLAAYEQITAIEIQAHEFEKTPKNSIKRYMYK